MLPLTVHTPAVVEASDTGRAEVEVATSAGGAVPRIWLPGEVKLMTCCARATANEINTDEAAAYVVLPAWLALAVQVPALSSVSVLPLTVHTAGVVDAKLTARPEVALAASSGAAVPRV